MIQDEYIDTLILQCCKNDRIAQEKLYYLFYNSMKNVVSKYIDKSEDVEEVLNNGFLTIFKKINQYKFAGSFEGWMKKIMYRDACTFMKLNKNHDKIIYVEDVKETSYNEKINDISLHNKLMTLINDLPKTTAKVFKMFVIDELKHVEISELVGITENTSKWHVREGRTILKEKINKLQLA